MNDMQMLANIAGMTAELIESGKLVRVVRCKDCKKQNEIECPLYRVLEDGTVYSAVNSDFYCG